MLNILFVLVAIIGSSSAFAAKPVCHDTHGGYCSYTGKVERIYINSGNVILLYFDTTMDDGEWEKAGYDAANRSATAIQLNDNPEFAKLFYSTALAAQASKRSISIQMRGLYQGYLKADRIWLSQD